MSEDGMRFVLIFSDAEAAALRAYAERDGMTLKEAARQLLMQGMERRDGERRCPQCDGTGWIAP